MENKKSQPHKTLHNKKALLEALEKTLGVVTTACKMVGVSRRTYYDYMKDPEFKEQVEDISEVAIDFAETQLHKQIRDNNISATIFYLKTKGKNRGYVERTESNINYNPNTFPEWLEDNE